jgi:molecular chaperone GrpE (heat shock protein)
VTDDTIDTRPDETLNDAEVKSAEERQEDESPSSPEEADQATEPEQEVVPTAELAMAVKGLDARLEESQRLLARQSDLVDRLHVENQELRAGELRCAQLPLIRDLLRLHDDVGRMREAAGESEHDLRLVHEGLSDTLARNGVEKFSPAHGDPFDPRFHAAAGVEPAADKALDKAVAEVVRQGFRWESGDTIRVAEVRAYRYRDVA